MVNRTQNTGDAQKKDPEEKVTLDETVPDDAAERPGTDATSHGHDDELADEWGRESFPSSDPPAHY